MLNFMKSAPAIERLPKERISKVYAIYRLRMFLAIFIGYAGYYLVRNNFAVAYGLSKFILGNLADKCNVKFFIGFGLLFSAIINIFFGFASSVKTMFGLMILNGLFQGMGAPPCSIVIAKWFSLKERGTKMGLWNTSHNVGGGLIAPLAGLALFIFGSEKWQSIFFFPASICILIAIFVIIVGADTPESVGLPSIEEFKNDYPPMEQEVKNSNKLTPKDIMFKYVLNNKYVWYLALANAFVYLVRYGVLNWAPIYLTEVKHFSAQSSRWAFFFFEYAAIPSSIILGWLSDKLFKGKRAPLSIICMVAVTVATLFYWKSGNPIVINIAIALIGCMIYGPQLLIGMNIIDIVPKFAVGTAVGFTGLMGYLCGELSANLVMGIVVQYTGWNGGFSLILAGCVVGIILLSLVVKTSNSSKNDTSEKDLIA